MDDFVRRHESRIVLLLCLAAAFRVFLFSAAFPFFNNIDEQLHLDMVHKHARGYLPKKGNSGFDRASAEWIVLHGSPEYLHDFPDSRAPPPRWRLSKTEQERQLAPAVAQWESMPNLETGAPPVYYILAGVWYNMGRLGGFQGGDLLYWIRFLNIPIAAGLVCLSHRFAQKFWPGQADLRLGCPLLVAFFPQDVLYGINSDAFSPLICGLALYTLLQLPLTKKGPAFHAFAGLMLALAILTKLSNCVLAIVAAGILLACVVHQSKEASHVGRWVKLSIFAVTASFPIVLWMAWNWHALGDLSGATEKITFLGWKLKPLDAWWNHPIFTPGGGAHFLRELIQTFWRGEVVWHEQHLTPFWADGFYVGSSCVFMLVSLGMLARRGRELPASERFAGWFCAGLLFCYLGFLVWLSLRFEFNEDSFYPSRRHPYFISGRLVLGGLIPFVALYVGGLSRLLVWLRAPFRPLVALVVISIGITISEIRTFHSIAGSPYNWFHLSDGRMRPPETIPGLLPT